MNDRYDDTNEIESSASAGNDESGWPERPDQLVYQLDAVLRLFERVQQGELIDLVDGLLDCVDWREMFGSHDSGFLRKEQIDELRRYYRSKFSALEPFYLAEQLSTELMTAVMVSGDLALSEELRTLGRERPDLWREIRTFFSRKELATTMLMLASQTGGAARGSK